MPRFIMWGIFLSWPIDKPSLLASVVLTALHYAQPTFPQGTGKLRGKLKGELNGKLTFAREGCMKTHIFLPFPLLPAPSLGVFPGAAGCNYAPIVCD